MIIWNILLKRLTREPTNFVVVFFYLSLLYSQTSIASNVKIEKCQTTTNPIQFCNNITKRLPSNQNGYETHTHANERTKKKVERIHQTFRLHTQ